MKYHEANLFTFLRAIALSLAVVLLVGCDSVDEDLDDVEVYNAPFFRSLNPIAAGAAVAGEGVFTIDDNQFGAEIIAEDVVPDMAHPQHIHAGSECPPPTADTNDDGIITIAEGAEFYGPVLIPLDDNLTDADAGSFPMPNDDDYAYEETADLDAMVAAHLEANEQLNLTTRTVVIHGASPEADLPEGINAATLPVACSEIVLVVND